MYYTKGLRWIFFCLLVIYVINVIPRAIYFKENAPFPPQDIKRDIVAEALIYFETYDLRSTKENQVNWWIIMWYFLSKVKQKEK